MNKEEILIMPAGREMDALIAEYVMGQTDFTHLPAEYFEGWSEDGKDGWDGWYCPRCMNSYEKCVKNYSTHLGASWEVVEKLDLFISLYLTRNIIYEIGHYGDCGFDEWTLFCSADTFPLAICRAALLTVMNKEDGTQTLVASA